MDATLASWVARVPGEDSMPPIVSFIGWHNSGKTTLCRQVVAHLKARGYLVAVIKSTKETGIAVDQPGTDTALYRKSGA
ncbi:MAG: molybdopterin-guanine dinucleotide biosynthesis protein B, partial [Desulfobulbus sp.]